MKHKTKPKQGKGKPYNSKPQEPSQPLPFLNNNCISIGALVVEGLEPTAQLAELALHLLQQKEVANYLEIKSLEEKKSNLKNSSIG